jgi:hypothetical protein
MSALRRPAQHESREPSLGMSIGIVGLILLGMFAIITNISVPDIQLTPAEFSVEL